MDADGSSKRSHRVRRAVKKLKFKPKVPPQKPKKLTTETPQQEEPKPIDEQLMKILRTRQVPANSAPNTKDERLTQKPPSTPPSADVVSLLPAQSAVHKQNQSVSVPRRQEFLAFNLAVLENILSFLTDFLTCLMYLLLYRFYVKRSHSKSPDPFLLLLIQVNVTINDFYSSEQYFPLRFFMGIFNPSQESLTTKRAITMMMTTIMKMLSFRILSQVQLNVKLQHVQQRSFICLYEPLSSAKLYS